MTQAPPPVAPVAFPAPAKRPGGLTALAVINFVFGGIAVFSAMGLVTLAAAANLVAAGGSAAANAATNDASREAINKSMAAVGASSGLLYLLAFVTLIVAVLLIVSGVGYLKMKKFGYMIGTAYALVAIISVVVQLVSLPFGVMNVLGLAYPIITLALLNTSFKKCFA